MKRFLFLTVFLPMSLLSNVTTNNVDDAYSKAALFYKAEDYKSSYEILSKIYLEKLNDINLNFYLGRSAFEIGNYEVALAAFERVEMLDPSNLANKLQMARTYYMLKMYEDSEIAFKEVLENQSLPENLKTNIELYLASVTKVQQKSFTYASINLDWVYDSNVNHGSLKDTYSISAGTFPTIAEKSDGAFQLYADIVNIYDIGQKNGFAIKNKGTFFLKEYQELNDYDIKYFAYSPSLLYKETKYLAELALEVDLLTLGDKKYLTTTSLLPKIEYSHTNTLRSIAHAKYQRKSFAQEKTLDADHYELSYGLQDILSPRSFIQGALIGITEKKREGKRIDIDYNEYKANIIYANQFTALFGTELFAEYRKREYKDSSTLFKNTRADNGGIIAATVHAKVHKLLRLHLKGSYNRVESNQDWFSYKKYTITTGLSTRF